MAALERLRHRPAARRRDKGGQKGELKQAEEVFRRWPSWARPTAGSTWPASISEEGRNRRRPCGAREGRGAPEARRPLGHQLADRPDQRRERRARRGHRQLRGRAANPDPRRGIRLQPRFRGHQRAGPVALTPRRGSSREESRGKEWLKKAIAAYHRTLAIDSEDVAAHYGLGLAFGDPAWGIEEAGRSGCRPTSDPPAVDPDELLKLAAAIADPEGLAPRTKGSGARAGTDLVVRYTRRANGPGSSRGSSRFTSWPRPSGPVWERETDAERPGRARPGPGGDTQGASRAAQARRDGRGPGCCIARKNDPAANMNAQSDRDSFLAPPRSPGIDAAGHARPRLRSSPPNPSRSNPAHAQESGE